MLEKVRSDARRHLGGMVAPRPSAVNGLGTGFGLKVSHSIEIALNNLRPIDEARVSGEFVGSVGVSGVEPHQADEISISIFSETINPSRDITIAAVLGDSRVSLLRRLEGAVNADPVLRGSGVRALVCLPLGVSEADAPFAELVIYSASDYSLDASGTGVIAPFVSLVPDRVDPIVDLGNGVKLYGYVPILNYLEGAIGGVSANLDTRSADVWQGNPREFENRKQLYNYWADRFADFLGLERKRNRAPQNRVYI